MDVESEIGLEPDFYALEIEPLGSHKIALFFGTDDDMAINTLETHVIPKLHELVDRIRRKNLVVLRNVNKEEPSDEHPYNPFNPE